MYPFNYYLNESLYYDRHKIFIAMPFDDKYECIYGDIIIPAINKANDKLDSEDKFTWYRGKDPKYTRTGWLQILENLFSSHFILGVLTDDNANVYYELGIAHATQQIDRQILIAEKGHKPKFDLKDLIYIEYDLSKKSNSIEELSKSIIDTAKRFYISNDRQISNATSKLSHYEFNIILQFNSKTHFNIPNDSPAILLDGVAHLCHAGLLRLSTKTKDINGKKIIEFSYYWTNLGNAVIHKLDLLSYDDLVKRIKNYNKNFIDKGFQPNKAFAVDC